MSDGGLGREGLIRSLVNAISEADGNGHVFGNTASHKSKGNRKYILELVADVVRVVDGNGAPPQGE